MPVNYVDLRASLVLIASRTARMVIRLDHGGWNERPFVPDLRSLQVHLVAAEACFARLHATAAEMAEAESVSAVMRQPKRP